MHCRQINLQEICYVHSLFGYPVKSMAEQNCAMLRIDYRGVLFARNFALKDETGMTALKQGNLQNRPELLKYLGENAQPRFGLYATPHVTGSLGIGDKVFLLD